MPKLEVSWHLFGAPGIRAIVRGTRQKVPGLGHVYQKFPSRVCSVHGSLQLELASDIQLCEPVLSCHEAHSSDRKRIASRDLPAAPVTRFLTISFSTWTELVCRSAPRASR